MTLASRSAQPPRRCAIASGIAVLVGAVGGGGVQARAGARGNLGMDVVVRLKADGASAGSTAARAAPSDGTAGLPADVAEVLRRHGARLAPMHPGSADPAMAAWFVVQAPSPERAEEIAAALRGLGSVDAAYVQPRPAPA